ncbi:hypothetical protein JTB14_013436 [Gonioctena quinquepunctata]|nr:hypothetical protein JTB14_013436 [Gonioctena quinquepunctata]
MDQQTARNLLEEGAFLIFLGVPEGTEFGIDMKSWNTGEKFRGDTAPRTGFFKNFRKSEVLVKKWDNAKECISSETVAEEEVVKLKDNIMALDGFLGPYPYTIRDKWLSLISYVSDSLIEKLAPLSGYIQSALELVSCSDADRPRGTAKTQHPNEEASPSSGVNSKRLRMSDDFEDSFLPKLKAVAGTELRLTTFPERSYPPGSTPSEITKHSLDSSYVLDQMVASYQKLVYFTQFFYA